MKLSEIRYKFCHLLKLKFTSERTVNAYVNVLDKYIDEFSRIERISRLQIEEYLIQFRKDYSVSYHNQMLSMLKLIYKDVLKQPRKVSGLRVLKDSKKAIPVIHPSQFWSVYNEISNLKHKALFLTLITTGVRSAELLSISLSDIDRGHMRIRINQGKGGDGRYVKLESLLLELLEEYYREYKPKKYLFEGMKGSKYSKSSLTKVIKKYNKNWYPHLMRHTYFTFLAVKGFNPFFAMNIAGHKSIQSQSQYIHFSPGWIKNTPDITSTYKSA